jgi:hypothetical protein
MNTQEILADLEDYKRADVASWKAFPSFKSLALEIESQYLKVLSTGLVVYFVNYDPYKDLDEMTDDIKTRRLLKISQLHNIHPLFTAEQNLQFRAIHDYAHYEAQSDFSLSGEYKTFLAQSAKSKPESVPALYTEIVLQAANMDEFGFFLEQKLFIARRYL